MLTFNHIGIFVKEIEFGINFFNKFLRISKKSNLFIDANMGVKVQFLYDKKNICYELVAPYKQPNPVSKVLKENKNILNHIAYQSDNFEADIKIIRNDGSIPLGIPVEAVAFNQARVIFFLTPLRFIIEVIEGSIYDR